MHFCVQHDGHGAGLCASAETCLMLSLFFFVWFHSRGAYQDQEEDQALSGLAEAVTLKSRGVTYKVSFICTCIVCTCFVIDHLDIH